MMIYTHVLNQAGGRGVRSPLEKLERFEPIVVSPERWDEWDSCDLRPAEGKADGGGDRIRKMKNV